jgi:rhodanese-related sulfurtransferase
MPLSLKQLMAEANAAVPRISPAEARQMMESGEAVVVDVRDAAELRVTGKVQGAVHISRGLLEFKADPESPAREPSLLQDRTVILYCGSGGRAALAGKTLKDFGYGRVFNMGGFKDWAEAGLPVDLPAG